MTINELRNKAFSNAQEKGFHEKPVNLGERLMLAVSELSEALEADRAGKWCNAALSSCKECKLIDILETDPEELSVANYEAYIRGTVEEELADAMIRLADIAGIYRIDLEWHIKAKMAYNRNRPHLHGKRYG